MKKFAKLFICVMLCVLSFTFVACDKRTDKEKNFDYPSSGATVASNGGLAVQKGNYVYFVNGYKSVSDDIGKKDTYTVGSLMLMKLGENGEIVKDENELVKDEYYITMSDALCGYEATNLYIYKNYLYFATPSLENETGDKVWAKERVVIKRIKLDKTGKVEKVYESGVKFDQFEYDYFETESDLYILAWEKGDSYYSSRGTDALVRVDALEKSYTVEANNVKSIAFAENSDQIFYVQKDETYELYQYNISEDEATLYDSRSNEFSVVAVGGGKVFISQAHQFSQDSQSTTDLYSSEIENKTGFDFVKSYYTENSKVSVSPDGKAVVIVDGENLKLISNGTTENISEDGATVSVVGFVNGSVVYSATKDSNVTIKMVSLDEDLENRIEEIVTLATISDNSSAKYYDLSEDSNYMYFYNKEGDNFYLNRLKVKNNLGEENEMIGVYLDEDAPEVEEETEEVEEEE